MPARRLAPHPPSRRKKIVVLLKIATVHRIGRAGDVCAFLFPARCAPGQSASTRPRALSVPSRDLYREPCHPGTFGLGTISWFRCSTPLTGTPQRLTPSMVYSALILALVNSNMVGDRLAEPAGVLQASHQRVAREASRVSTRSFKMVPACRAAALARFPSRDRISALQPDTMSLSVARSTPDASPSNP